MSSNIVGSRRSPVPSIAVGLVAAVVAAVLWAVVVNVTNYKIGIAAVGVGLLVGLAMSRITSDWRGLPVVAAVVALFGCLLGDVFVDASILAEVTRTSTLSALGDMIADPALAQEVFTVGFEGLDVVFWALAAVAAFRMTHAAVATAAEKAVPLAAPAPHAPSGGPTA